MTNAAQVAEAEAEAEGKPEGAAATAVAPAGGPVLKTKVTVNFAPDTYNTLSAIAESWQTSMAEVLRRAIALLAFYDSVRVAGDELLVRNHKTQELDRIKLL